MVSNIMGVLVVIVVISYLTKKGWITYRFPPIKLGYIYSYSPKKFHASYLYYNGINKRQLHVKPGEPVTLKYDVSVAKGSFVLRITQKNEILFKKNFVANIDEEDTITITPEGRFITVTMIGKYTMGGCDVDIV